MGSVSFKQFSRFVDLAEDEMSEDQLNEIFGVFRNNDKVQKLMAQRAALRASQSSASKAVQAEKDKLFKAAKEKVDALQKTVTRPLTPKQLDTIKDKIWADVAAELATK